MKAKDKKPPRDWLREELQRVHDRLYEGTLLRTEVLVTETKPDDEDEMGRYRNGWTRSVAVLESEEEIPDFLEKYEPNQGNHFSFTLVGYFEVMRTEKRKLKTLKPPA